MSNWYKNLIRGSLHTLQEKIYDLILAICTEVFDRPFVIRIDTIEFQNKILNYVLRVYRHIPKIYAGINRTVMEDGDDYFHDDYYFNSYSYDEYL